MINPRHQTPQKDAFVKLVTRPENILSSEYKFDIMESDGTIPNPIL